MRKSRRVGRSSSPTKTSPKLHRKHRKKVGKVGRVPFFIGFFAVSKLANLTKFNQSRHHAGWVDLRTPPNLAKASSRTSKKSWPSWPSSLFHRLFCRFEVGQLDQVQSESPSPRVGRSSRPAKTSQNHHRNHRKKVDQVGKDPCFIGFLQV